MHPSLVDQLPHITALCKAQGVLHLELFGSATGTAFKPESSDYDFLVELDTQAPGSRAKRWMALGAIASAREFVDGVSLAQYATDKMRRSAVERQLEILGEACSRLARLEPSFLTSVSALKLAIDLRNRIIDSYDTVDDEMVYLTVTEDLAELPVALTHLLDALRNAC
jgi:uncharacterized protein with HEPN domain